MIDAYLEFLKAGNSASPSELLRIADVDPLADETYEDAGICCLAGEENKAEDKLAAIKEMVKRQLRS